MKKNAVLAAVAMTLAACASGGPVPTGNGLYYLGKKSIACGFSNGDGAKLDLMREADAFCRKLGKEVQIDTSINKPGIVGRQCATAEVTFSCADHSNNQGRGHMEEHVIN